jgi:RND family efflux transporter MFP subunit
MNKIQYLYRFVNKYTIIGTILLVVLIISIKLLNNPKKSEDSEVIRPVRTIVIEHQLTKKSLSLTGEILAKNELDLSFRIDGKLIQRLVSIGDLVSVGQTIAYIDPQDAKDNLTNARASLNAAQSFLTLSVSNEARQKILLSKGVITNETYENALSQLQSAQAKVDGANASLNQAQNRLEYTNLQMDVAGVVTSTKAEAGEIIKAGQAIISVATNEGLDAVFNVPEQLFHNENKISNLPVEVSLSHSPSIKTIGIVREISPQADSITRTFTVKVALNNPPKELKLGSTVTGSVNLNQGSAIEIPVMALNKSGANPAVWVVDKTNNTVNLRNIKILSYTQDSIIISDGLENGEIVVIAGVNSLYQGQVVKLLEK